MLGISKLLTAPAVILRPGAGVDLDPITGIILEHQESFLAPSLTLLEKDLTPYGMQQHDVLVFQIGGNTSAAVQRLRDGLLADGFDVLQSWYSNFPPLLVMGKRMGATPDASCTLDLLGQGERLPMRGVVLRGCERVASYRGPTSVSDGTPHNNRMAPPDITTTVDGSFILLTSVLDDDNATLSSITGGWVGADVLATNGGGANSTLGYAHQFQTTAGLVGPSPLLTFSSLDSIRSGLVAFNPRVT